MNEDLRKHHDDDKNIYQNSAYQDDTSKDREPFPGNTEKVNEPRQDKKKDHAADEPDESEKDII